MHTPIENDDDPLVLELRHEEQRLEVWLGRPFEYCTKNGPDCERMAREYLESVVQAANESLVVKVADPTKLIPAIRSLADVESYRARAQGILVAPIAADLFLVYMLDEPRFAGARLSDRF